VSRANKRSSEERKGIEPFDTEELKAQGKEHGYHEDTRIILEEKRANPL
jgi:hypothetical protein